MDKTKCKKIAISLPVEVHIRAKIKCEQNGNTLSGIIKKLLRQWVKEKD